MSKAFTRCNVNIDRFMTVQEFAQHYHYNRQSVHYKIRQGYLNAVKIKNVWYIPRDGNRAGTGKKQQPERIYINDHFWLLTESYAQKYCRTKTQIQYLLSNKRLPIIKWKGRRYIREDFPPPIDGRCRNIPVSRRKVSV